MEDITAILESVTSNFQESLRRAVNREEKKAFIKNCSQSLYEILAGVHSTFLSGSTQKNTKMWQREIRQFLSDHKAKELGDEENALLQRNLSFLERLIKYRNDVTHETVEIQPAEDMLNKSSEAIVFLLKVFASRKLDARYFPKVIKKFKEPAPQILWVRFWRLILEESEAIDNEYVLTGLKDIGVLGNQLSDEEGVSLSGLACKVIHRFPERIDNDICEILGSKRVASNLPPVFSELLQSDIYRKEKDNYKSEKLLKKQKKAEEKKSQRIEVLQELKDSVKESPPEIAEEITKKIKEEQEKIERPYVSWEHNGAEELHKLFNLEIPAEVADYITNKFGLANLEHLKKTNLVRTLKSLQKICNESVPEVFKKKVDLDFGELLKEVNETLEHPLKDEIYKTCQEVAISRGHQIIFVNNERSNRLKNHFKFDLTDIAMLEAAENLNTGQLIELLKTNDVAIEDYLRKPRATFRCSEFDFKKYNALIRINRDMNSQMVEIGCSDLRSYLSWYAVGLLISHMDTNQLVRLNNKIWLYRKVSRSQSAVLQEYKKWTLKHAKNILGSNPEEWRLRSVGDRSKDLSKVFREPENAEFLEGFIDRIVS